ncbi:P-loop containing nucleoside triphosphate hydrolase protein, partial [Mycena crocata]
MAPANRDKGESILRYATVAASTLRDIADSSPTPFLRTIAALSLSILSIIQAVKKNKDECIRMVSNIDELLSVILHLCKSESSGNLSPARLHDIGRFAETLQKIHCFIEAQQNTSRFKRIFRQSENSAQLEECNSGLRHALDVFGIRTSVVATTEMADIREQAEKRHQELVQLFARGSEAADSDTHSLVEKNTSIFNLNLRNSTTSLLMLPAKPKIFHGREAELQELVHLLLQTPARGVILGPGGIGKTSLGTAALHHPDIDANYTLRHFVSCESAASYDDLVSSIVSHLGLAGSGKASKRLLRHLSESPPSVLLLDNLETCWEPLGCRSNIEEFLSLLTDIEHVALLVTMRGVERPGRVKWTRPFLPPLEPLTNDAAMQIFVDITDSQASDNRDIQDLLNFTNNLPLAVNLLANIAAFEGSETVISRWKDEKTRLFSEGPDKRSNLDLSIQISMSSPRMFEAPGARQLLSLLSLLPDGISDTDLLQSDFAIPELGRSRTTLIRTSLAYVDHDNRLRVLAPTREYIQTHNAPSPSLCRPLRRHFHGLMVLWRDYQHLSTAGISLRIGANLGNFHSVLTHGLRWEEPDLAETLQSIILFDRFCRVSGRRSSGLLERIPAYLEHLQDHRVHAAYLTEVVRTWQYHPISDLKTVEGSAEMHLRAIGDVSGEANLLCAIGSYYRRHDNNISLALQYYEKAMSLCDAVGDAKTRCIALREAAESNWQLGNFSEAQKQTAEMREVAQIH